MADFFNCKLLNLNKHLIRLRVDATNQQAEPLETDIVFEPSGTIATVQTIQKPVGSVNGVIIYETTYGPIQHLPPLKLDTLYIVNAIVLQAARIQFPERFDLIAPNTAPGKDIRDSKGFTYAITSFQVF